jgi:hypothetical protein
MAAVGRVAFSRGESSSKSLALIGAEVVTGGREADPKPFPDD